MQVALRCMLAVAMGCLLLGTTPLTNERKASFTASRMTVDIMRIREWTGDRRLDPVIKELVLVTCAEQVSRSRVVQQAPLEEVFDLAVLPVAISAGCGNFLLFDFGVREGDAFKTLR